MSDSKQVYNFEGGAADVAWDGRLCIHLSECTRAKGDIFESGRNPWCQSDGADCDYVAEVVLRCPTGALTYRRKDGGVEEAPEPENTIMVSSHGPLYVRGDLLIDGAAEDMPGVRFRAALCRCGESKNKPFCDNSHEEAGFRDSGACGDTGAPLIETGGALEVKQAPNGPSAGERKSDDRVRQRPDRVAGDQDGALPLRPIEQQALLRRHAQAGRLRRVTRTSNNAPGWTKRRGEAGLARSSTGIASDRRRSWIDHT